MYETLTKRKLSADILSAIRKLYSNDADRILIEKSANERCIVAHIFYHLRRMSESDPAYGGLSFDCEYNRKGLQGEAKEMGGGNNIIPDLVLHKRGVDGCNIFACEFKKGKFESKDSKKLSYLTGPSYEYRYGIQVVLKQDAVTLVWFNCKRQISHEVYDTTTWEQKSPFPEVVAPVGRRSCTLMITRNCNLRCKYCFEPFKCNDKTKEMSFATAKSIIKQEAALVEKSDRFNELAIDFMGGEPLMNFPLIKKVVEWLEKKPIKVPCISYATTNGTLISKHEKWLREHSAMFKLGGSYDGTLEMQRLNRGMCNGFENNIKLLHDIYPETGFHMVVSKDTLSRLAEGVLSVQRLGYKIKASLAQGVDWNESDAMQFRRQLEMLAREYLKRGCNLKPLNLLSSPLINVGKDPQSFSQVKWCGSGVNMVAYDYDGKSYGCHMFTPVVLGKKAIECMHLDYTSSHSICDAHCVSCHLKNICPTCIGFNYRYRGSLEKRDYTWCKMIDAQVRVACAFQIKRLARIKKMSEYEKMLSLCAMSAWTVINSGVSLLPTLKRKE